MSEHYTISDITFDEWQALWPRALVTNMPQAWEYGEMKAELEGWKPKRVVVHNEKQEPVALTQWLTKTLPVIGGVARLNRGPIFLEKQNLQNSLKITRAVLKMARKNSWWVIQVAPELPQDEQTKDLLTQCKLKLRKTPHWGSGLLDLSMPENDLLMSFQGTWRNCLRKGERLGVMIKHAANLEGLLESYQTLQKNRDFEGLSENQIRTLAKYHHANWQ